MANEQYALTAEGSPEQSLDRYKALLSLSVQINALARQSNWAELIEKQAQYVVESERMARLESPAMPNTYYEKKADLLERIFSLDLETRSLLVARREQLRRQIDSAKRDDNGAEPLHTP